MGVLGLGDAAVQQRHPDLRLHRAVPDHRRRSCRPTSRRSPRTTRPTSPASPRCRASSAGPSRRAGLFIALLAPVLGQRADAHGSPQAAARDLHRLADRAACSRSSSCRAEPAFFILGHQPDRRRQRVRRDRRRELQRDARAGRDPKDRRQGQRARLGPRLHRRHHRAGPHRRDRPGVRTGSACRTTTACASGSSRSAARSGRSCSASRSGSTCPRCRRRSSARR